VREGDGDQGIERENELSWTVFENTRDLLGDLLRAKNAGVTVSKVVIACLGAKGLRLYKSLGT
jgi:hypothetical protein